MENSIQESSASTDSWFGVDVDTWATRIHQAFGVAKENALVENEALNAPLSVSSAQSLAKALTDINLRLEVLENAVGNSARSTGALAH